MNRRWHYVLVLSVGPLIIARIPYPNRWKAILKAFTGLMSQHGLRQKDISSVEGVVPHPGEPKSASEEETLRKLELAFAGDPESFAAFRLYSLEGSEFVLVRDATERTKS